MIEFIDLLLWIFSLYFISWSHTRVRTESVLITTNKNLKKILFFIDPSRGISIGSIISGLFAHFSLCCCILFILFNSVTKTYSELITITWIWMGFLLLSVGETIETYIKLKREEIHKKKRVFLYTLIILIFSTIFIFCFTFIYGLALYKAVFIRFK